MVEDVRSSSPEFKKLTKVEARIIIKLGTDLRSVVRYMHDGTQDGLDTVLLLCKRFGEPCSVRRAVATYYGYLTRQKAREAAKEAAT